MLWSSPCDWADRRVGHYTPLASMLQRVRCARHGISSAAAMHNRRREWVGPSRAVRIDVEACALTDCLDCETVARRFSGGRPSMSLDRIRLILICGLTAVCAPALAQTPPAKAAPAPARPAPAPVVARPAPAPVVARPAPAPVVARPAPAPVVAKPAPA